MTIECPACGATAVRREMETERFQYGQGKGAVALEALVPVFTCEACEFRYTDHEAEGARNEAVCRHLQLMTPDELQKIRSDLGMSREELAELSGLGVASIARWELGATIQNKANDNYIYLLSFPENRSRITSRFVAPAKKSSPKVVPIRPGVFRALCNSSGVIDENLSEQARVFQLQRRG